MLVACDLQFEYDRTRIPNVFKGASSSTSDVAEKSHASPVLTLNLHAYHKCIFAPRELHRITIDGFKTPTP